MPNSSCQTPPLQVIHKYSVPPSEGCLTPFEGFHLQAVKKKVNCFFTNEALRSSYELV